MTNPYIISSAMLYDRFIYLIVLVCTCPLRWLSYRSIHKLGSFLGICLFYGSSTSRKRTLNNLSLASSLNLPTKELISLAKRSLQNVMITCLEYPRLATEKNIHRLVHCENPEEVEALYSTGISPIFFCGHQANWELFFLEGTTRMKGVAIGRPIKNQLLYNWALRIRQKYGGKIIPPKEAVWAGLRALKAGSFLGIVGDQGMPESGLCSLFLGRKAWTSPIPALLAYKTGFPIIVATMKRKKATYLIRYSKPIWPNRNASLQKEVQRMMEKALSILENSIIEQPDQWLWLHNRWKQQSLKKIKRQFRFESICVIMPKEKSLFEKIASDLKAFREIYPHEFITLKIPQDYSVQTQDMQVEYYVKEDDILQSNFYYKLIYNFSPYTRLCRYFLKFSAFQVISLEQLYRLGSTRDDQPFAQVLKRAVLRAP